MLQSKKLIRILSDFVAINIALFITYCWFFHDWSFIFKQESRIVFVLINLLWVSVLFIVNQLYGGMESMTFKKELKKVIRDYTIHFVLFSVIELFINTPKSEIYFYWLASFYCLLFMMLFLGRLLLRTIFNGLSKAETLKYVVVGYSKALNSIENALSEEHFGKIQYLGYFSKDGLNGQNYLGKVDNIYDYLKTNESNLILCAPNEMPTLKVQQLMNYAKHNFIDFKLIPLEIEMFSSDITMEVRNGYPLMSAKNESITRIRSRLLKRTFDIVFSFFVIIFILSWLYPILALLIKLESKGPVLFLQQRIGFQNKPFTCIKFRSMVLHAEKEGVKQATENDHRVTKIGAFMRRTNLDEMPQFINVLIGNMSVVGPRPHAISHDIQYQNTVEDYILRHYTKPGITGWAQVNGWRGPTDTTQKIIGRAEHDVWYLRNWSFWLDLKIIFMTAFTKQSRLNAF